MSKKGTFFDTYFHAWTLGVDFSGPLLYYNRFMETNDWISLGIGIFASAIALTALCWNIIRERPTIRLKVVLLGEAGILVSMQVIVTNVGKYPVFLYGVGYITYGNDYMIFSPEHFNLPETMKPGEEATFWEDLDVSIRDPDNRIKYVWIRDGYRRYRCKIPIYWK